MKVLTIDAHHDPRSFCHAVLERFDAGPRDAGQATETVDLHAIGFDAVHGADAPTRDACLSRAYALGRDFGD